VPTQIELMAKKKNRPNNLPPAKDGKKKKDSEVLYPCVTCGKEVDSECIECEWCYNWDHKDCVGLSNDIYLPRVARLLFSIFLCGGRKKGLMTLP